MKTTELRWDGSDPAELAGRLRAAAPAPTTAIAADVATLVAEVRSGGDASLLELCERFDGVRPAQLEVPPERCDEALGALPQPLGSALAQAAANIEAVARAQVAPEPVRVEPGAGHSVTIEHTPVAVAGIYVPGGRSPYPSTALMGVLAARAARVERVVVASPPSAPAGEPHEAVLGACELAGADAVYAMGGAQAIAALAYGTETVPGVDVIAGPGGPWVQEAKLAVSRQVGIDGYAGPSELVVVADGSTEAEWVALDLGAQAEHGADGLLVAIGTAPGALEGIASQLDAVSEAPSASDAPVTLVEAPGVAEALALAEALAPEHLELCCAGADRIASGVRTAGCVLVGPYGATAFGDYAAGSNHVLPTGGSGRFSGPLGPGTFRRATSTVRMNRPAAVELAGVVTEIARSEGFDVHAASAQARAGGATEEES